MNYSRFISGSEKPGLELRELSKSVPQAYAIVGVLSGIETRGIEIEQTQKEGLCQRANLSCAGLLVIYLPHDVIKIQDLVRASPGTPVLTSLNLTFDY